jgi:hypothetical protein
MRKHSLGTILSLVLLASMIGLSCEKSNQTSPYADFLINFTSNDTPYNTINQTGLYKPVEGTIYVTASVDPKITIEVSWMDSIVVNKAFPLSTGASITYTDNWTVGNYGTFVANGQVGHGTITVTWWNKTSDIVSGTFSGVLYNTTSAMPDSLVITNGAFNVNYSLGS